jgi:hypothetical protein
VKTSFWLFASRLGLAVVVAVVTLTAAPVAAQQLPAGGRLPPGSQRPLFGERNPGDDVLLLTFGTSASSQERGEPSDLDEFDVPNKDSRFYADVNGGLAFNPRSEGPFKVSLNAASAVRRYETGDEFMVLGHSAGGRVQWAATRRTAISAQTSFTYLPSYSLRWALLGDPEALVTEAGTLPPSAVDFSLGKRISFNSGGGAGVTQTLTRRLSVTASYNDHLQRYSNEAYRSQRQREARGRFNYGLAKGMSLRLGYGRRESRTEGPRGSSLTAIDDIDVGIDMARALSLTRTTTVSFSSGTFVVEQEGRREANLMGGLSVQQQVGRTGVIAFQAYRRAELQDGFVEPVLSNGASLIGAYQPAQRVFFNVSANAAKGRTLDRTGATEVDVYSGFARLGYAFSARGQVYAQYLVSNHDIGGDVQMIGLFPRHQVRHTARIGVNWSLPLANDRSRPVAPRGPSAAATP